MHQPNQYQPTPQPTVWAPSGYAGPPPQYGPTYPSGFGYGQPTPAVGTNGLAIASLVVSIAGGCLYSIGGLVGIILGIVALNQIKQTGQQGRGLAIAGIAVGATYIAVFLVILLFALVVSASSG